MTATLNALQAVINDAYEAHYHDDDTVFYARLGARERTAVLVQRLTGQVYNGGWAQWIYNGYGASYHETIAALHAINTPAALEAARLVGLVAPTAKLYAEMRGREVKLDHLDAYDGPMWELSDQLLADTAAYLGL